MWKPLATKNCSVEATDVGVNADTAAGLPSLILSFAPSRAIYPHGDTPTPPLPPPRIFSGLALKSPRYWVVGVAQRKGETVRLFVVLQVKVLSKFCHAESSTESIICNRVIDRTGETYKNNRGPLAAWLAL